MSIFHEPGGGLLSLISQVKLSRRHGEAISIVSDMVLEKSANGRKWERAAMGLSRHFSRYVKQQHMPQVARILSRGRHRPADCRQ
jgi:hypothetical protein